MEYEFLGKPDSFWTGLYTLTTIIGTGVVALSGGLIFWQLRLATRTLKFDGIRRMQELADSFRDERIAIYKTFPKDLIVAVSQFARRPPRRAQMRRVSWTEPTAMKLTPLQHAALLSLRDEQVELAKRVIAKLNDIGQLVEDGFVDRDVFLGKYHTMVIRLCHFLEAVRRQEEEHQGGCYGHRLLRMRHMAMRFNAVWPKHRANGIRIVTASGSTEIVAPMEGSAGDRFCWWIQRIIHS